MALLKKIKSATLIEALVATVLVVIIFIIASLVLNNLLLNTYSQKSYIINCKLNQLSYEIQNDLISLPYNENYQGWEIKIDEKIDSKNWVDMYATHQNNNKKTYRRIYVE